MNKLIFLIGLPGSGKTTYAKNHLIDCEVLSSDDIRKELFCDETNQTDNNLIFSTLFNRARKLLLQGKDVVIDATNVSLTERQNALNKFNDMLIERVAIVINTPVNKCIEQDAMRERTVGKNIIYKFKSRFTKPTKKEGFNKIIYVNKKG